MATRLGARSPLTWMGYRALNGNQSKQDLGADLSAEWQRNLACRLCDWAAARGQRFHAGKPITRSLELLLPKRRVAAIIGIAGEGEFCRLASFGDRPNGYYRGWL